MTAKLDQSFASDFHCGKGRGLLVWLTLAAFAALPLFWFGFEGLAQEWARPEFQFKGLVPLVSMVMFLQAMPSALATEQLAPHRWVGATIVILALLVAFLGNMMHIDDFVFVAIIAWLAGLILTSFGLRRGLAFWVPVSSLVLMLPLPRFVYAPIQRTLEGLASELGIWLSAVYGTPARIEGLFIDFGTHHLRVADATSGLVVFLPVLLVFLLVGTLYRGPLWIRLFPLILAAPVLVAMTAFRIALIGSSLDASESKQEEWVLGSTGGWVFFAVCVALLFLLVLGARQLVGQRRGGGLGADIDLTVLVRVVDVGASRALITATIFSAALSIAFEAAPTQRPPVIGRDGFWLFPPDIAGWHGSDFGIDPRNAKNLNASDYVLLDYFNRAERTPVNFWSAYYLEQRSDLGGIHSPQDCLPLDGWNIVSFGTMSTFVRDGAQATISVNRAVIEKGQQRALVYYWFDGRGRRIVNERLARLAVKLDGLLKRRTDGALVRFATLILDDESEADADARLQRFMTVAVPQLPRFIPD